MNDDEFTVKKLKVKAIFAVKNFEKYQSYVIKVIDNSKYLKKIVLCVFAYISTAYEKNARILIDLLKTLSVFFVSESSKLTILTLLLYQSDAPV